MNRNPAQLLPVLVGFGIVAIAFAILILNDRLKARNGRPIPNQRPKSNPTPAWLWLFLIVLVGAIVFLTSPRRNPNGPRLPASNASGWICLGAVGLAVGSVAVLYIRAYWKYGDRAVTRALKQAGDGDVEGAIVELTREIDARGPSANRLNGLGQLSVMAGDWPRALDAYKAALAMAPGRLDLENNLATALIRTGRAEEAEPILARLAAASPQQMVYLSNHARALIELGRLDEAEALMERVESLLAQTINPSRQDVRGPMQAEIDLNRAKIAEARGLKGKEPLEEL